MRDLRAIGYKIPCEKSPGPEAGGAGEKIGMPMYFQIEQAVKGK
jgi:hypothetical protein